MLRYVVTQKKNAKLFWSANSDPEYIHTQQIITLYNCTIFIIYINNFTMQLRHLYTYNLMMCGWRNNLRFVISRLIFATTSKLFSFCLFKIFTATLCFVSWCSATKECVKNWYYCTIGTCTSKSGLKKAVCQVSKARVIGWSKIRVTQTTDNISAILNDKRISMHIRKFG